jgi:ABC-type glycerol-3-phosphate transport system permease component
MVIRETAGDRIFNAINVFVLTLLMLLVLYPLYFVFIASFSDPVAVSLGRMFLWPVEPTFRGYELVFNTSDVWLGYRNSIFYAGAGTAIHLFVTLPAAYALSRKDFRWRRFFVILFLIPMFFNGGLIANFLLIARQLELRDTPWALLLPAATSLMPIAIARTFFTSTIPDELREAAQIDGCSNFRLFVGVVLPLSSAIIAVLSLQHAVMHWNSYWSAMLYLSTRGGRHLWPLQVVLRNILILGQIEADMDFGTVELTRRLEMLRYSLIVVSIIPILLIYPFIQRYFVKGIMIGSLKG